MIRSIESDRKKSMSRYYDSSRHTIQVDPIVYCDELSRTFGGKPEVSRHLGLARRLLFGSCGPAQYRLQGPFKTAEAKKLVRNIPMPYMANAFCVIVIVVSALLVFCLHFVFVMLN